MIKTGSALAIAALALTIGAQAQASDSMAFAIGTCAAQTDPQQRLACYDGIAARLKAEPIAAAPTASAAAPVATASPPAAAPQNPVQSFGMSPPPAKDDHSWYDVGGWFGGSEQPRRAGPVQSAAQFGAEDLPKPEPGTGAEPAELDEITAKVTSVAYSAAGRFTITLDNGQVWRQVPGDTTNATLFKPGGGDQVTISRGFMGSFNLSVEGHNVRYKVRRDL